MVAHDTPARVVLVDCPPACREFRQLCLLMCRARIRYRAIFAIRSKVSRKSVGNPHTCPDGDIPEAGSKPGQGSYPY